MKKKELGQIIKRAILPVAAASLVWTDMAGAADLGVEQGFPDIFVNAVEFSFDYEFGILRLEEGFVSSYAADSSSSADMTPDTAIEMAVEVPLGQSDVGGIDISGSNVLGNANGADLIITGSFFNGSDMIGIDDNSVLLELDLTRIAFGGASDVEDEVQLLGNILGGVMVDEGLMGEEGSETGLIIANVGYAGDEDTLRLVADGGWERLTNDVLNSLVEPATVPVFVAGTPGTLDITTEPAPPPTTVPIPAPIALMGLGLLGMASFKRK